MGLPKSPERKKRRLVLAGEEYQGRGYATEAARALIDLIRADGRIGSVVAHTFPELAASVRVMERCGLRYEGEGDEAGTVRYRLRF